MTNAKPTSKRFQNQIDHITIISSPQRVQFSVSKNTANETVIVRKVLRSNLKDGGPNVFRFLVFDQINVKVQLFETFRQMFAVHFRSFAFVQTRRIETTIVDDDALASTFMSHEIVQMFRWLSQTWHCIGGGLHFRLFQAAQKIKNMNRISRRWIESAVTRSKRFMLCLRHQIPRRDR
jgi:hypothetical protein